MRLLDRGHLVATATPAPDLEDADPAPVSLEAARAAEERYEGLVDHPFPTCFSCGTARTPGDGLCLRPGPLDDGTGRYAATWTPDEVDVPLVWAALDCPGGWSAGIAGRPMVLGTMTARIRALPETGRPPRRPRVAAWVAGAPSPQRQRPAVALRRGDRPGRGDVGRRRPHHDPSEGERMTDPTPPTDDLTPTGSASETLVKDGPRTPDDEGVPILDAVRDERRTAVVTGASSGIGAATARLLADHGFRVVCAARRADRVEALAEEIGGLAVACDVTSDADVARLAEAAGERVHVLVNNAGGALGLEPVAQAEVDLWRSMYESNVLGTLRVTKALLPALVAADGEGVVVNVGSIAGFTAYEGGGGYTAAKHGVHVMTETLRLELFDQPVRVTLVAPGDGAHRGVLAHPLRRRPGAGRQGLRRRRPPARRRGRRRRHRLDGDPAGPRQRRPPRRQAPRPGRAAQGPPDHPDAAARPAPAARLRAGAGDPPGRGVAEVAVPTRVKTSRSCSRLRRPAQNSTSSGTTR